MFDTLPQDEMPTGYMEIRNHIKRSGIKLQTIRDIFEKKMLLYAGVQNLSPENVNTNNERRFEIYHDFLRFGYPHLKIEEHKKQSVGSIDELVEEYKKTFGKHATNKQQEKDLHSGSNVE